MKHALIAAGLLVVALATPLAAETPAPDAAPGAAPGAAPAAKPDPAERQRNSAAKLAGMIRFVAADCPDAQPDYDRFKAIIARMGVDIKDLEDGPLMGQSLSYSQAYHKEPAASCKKAFELFGETGTTIPQLIARKTPQAMEAPKAPESPKPAEAPADGTAPAVPESGAAPKP